MFLPENLIHPMGEKHKRGLMNIVPYQVEKTNDLLTANAGLVCLAELLKKINFNRLTDGYFPAPASNRGFPASRFVNAFMLMHHKGGSCLDDIVLVKQDEALCKLLGMCHLPEADSAGDWLRRMGQTGTLACSKLLSDSVKPALGNCRAVTLDIDATLTASENKNAKWTYKKCKGYMPMVGTIAETSQIIAVDFREGNVSPNTDNLGFIEQCQSALPADVNVKGLRIDAAGYQHKIIDSLTEQGIEFAIRAKMSATLKQQILSIPEDQWTDMINHQGGIVSGEQTTRLVHTMQQSRHAFEVVVQRKQIQGQMALDIEGTNDECLTKGAYIYRAIAINSKRSNSELIHWYNQRGDDSENRIKDLKADFGAQKMPCRDFDANALYFSLCALSHNIFTLLRLALPGELHNTRIKRVRLKLYNIAAKVVRHARCITLKVQKRGIDILLPTLQNIRSLPIGT